MIRTVLCEPLIADWISFQVDERDVVTGKWVCVAARSRPDGHGAGSFHIGAEFSARATTYRIVWVGDGGSKNMRIGPALPIDDATTPRRRLGGPR